MAPVCISDSRGRYLGDSLSNVLYEGEHLYSFFHPGAKLTNLKDKVEDLIQEMPVTSLYIMAGVNDITTRGRNGKCHVTFETAEQLSAHVMDEVLELMRFCYTECHVAHVIMLPLTGLDVNRYNRVAGKYWKQGVVNDGIMLLNRDIITTNAGNGYHTPMVQRYVHKHAYRRVKHMYGRLWDGLHPRGDTLERWAGNIVTAMRYNKHLK